MALPQTGITVSAIKQEIGVSSTNISYLNSNTHGQTNAHSYYKPVRNNSLTGITMTNDMYRDSTKLKTYKIGDSIPDNTKMIYNAPIAGTHPCRMGDWRGYDHEEYALRCDFSNAPINWNFENTSITAAMIDGSDRPLFNYLMNEYYSGYWKNSILIIAKKGTQTRYFIESRSGFSNWKINIGFSGGYDRYRLFRDMKINEWTCYFYGISIPYAHPDKNDDFHEVFPSDNYTYQLLPEWRGIKIGRVSCRERVYVLGEISVVDVSFSK